MTTSQRRLGLLFIMVGPPGVGKNTLMNLVLGRVDNLRQLPTATTRARRPKEEHGREHLFVSRDEFQKMVDAKALVEPEGQEVHGEFYGMPKAAIEEAIAQEHDLIADIDVKGATYLRLLYPDNAVLIFIQPASVQDLRSQMEARGETELEIEKRMRRVEMEMQYAPLCDYLITNEKDDLETANETLYGIIQAERSYRALLNLRFERGLPRHKFTYVSSIVPVCGDEVLYRTTPPHFPTAQLTHGEFPHDAALRALRQDIGIDVLQANLYPGENANEDNFIIPISLENHIEQHFQQINFFYLYRLSSRINPPQHWDWVNYQNLQLSDDIQNTIRSQIGEIPAVSRVESSHEPA